MQIGVECRFKRRIANVSDVITSVMLKMRKHISYLTSSMTTYRYKIGLTNENKLTAKIVI